jgi:hypothetical protein
MYHISENIFIIFDQIKTFNKKISNFKIDTSIILEKDKKIMEKKMETLNQNLSPDKIINLLSNNIMEKI